MSTEIFLRYLHFISILAIAATLVAEHLLLKRNMTRAEIGRLATIDAVYGISALTLLVAGLTLWLSSVGKPAAFYSGNWIFHTKLTLFAMIGLLSIYPTAFFLRNRKGDPDELLAIPERIFWMLRLELILLFIIPLLAGFMAKGIGLG